MQALGAHVDACGTCTHFLRLWGPSFTLFCLSSSLARGRNIAHYYPTWPEAQKFFNAIRLKRSKGQSMLHHDDISLIIGDIVDSFGIFQAHQWKIGRIYNMCKYGNGINMGPHGPRGPFGLRCFPVHKKIWGPEPEPMCAQG